jgi:hypothetical protein
VDASGVPAAFIRTFARAIDLASIGGTARRTIFAVLGDGLRSRVGELLHVTVSVYGRWAMHRPIYT